ncbi:MAG: thiamine pyrophosphate-binding protein [Syntrophobacteraceae bacterium]|nr:hypothetical protein [Desulfobacteraceae bacterium]
MFGLFEGVFTGAADGWARMTGNPAATLLRFVPGFANGIANLYNARRVRTPAVIRIGNQSTRHRALDVQLTSDIELLAGVVDWTRSVKSPCEMAEASLAAGKASRKPERSTRKAGRRRNRSHSRHRYRSSRSSCLAASIRDERAQA